MSMMLEPADDGSMTISCGDEELTIYPDGRVQVRRKHKRLSPLIGTGAGHQAIVKLPARAQLPLDTFGAAYGSVHWHNSADFSTDLIHEVKTRSATVASGNALRVEVSPGTVVDLHEMLTSADEIAADALCPIELWISMGQSNR